MAVEIYKETWSNQIITLTLGATPEQGGTRERAIKIGGERTLPFLHFEGEIPYRPIVALEIMDIEPPDWPEVLREPFKECLSEPVKWAQKCVEEFGLEVICISLRGAHPEFGNKKPTEIGKLVEEIKKQVKVPLIILGVDIPERDNEILPLCSDILKGENCLFGFASQDNYKTLVASCIANKHSLIALSPIDVNIAKQLNILITDLGFPLERIVIYPTTGGLGYGFEYAYSIMERARISGLNGDKMLALPILCMVGSESWKAKEAKSEEVPAWGDIKERGPLWEATTGCGFLQAGADILIMRHPKAAQIVKEAINELMEKKED